MYRRDACDEMVQSSCWANSGPTKAKGRINLHRLDAHKPMACCEFHAGKLVWSTLAMFAQTWPRNARKLFTVDRAAARCQALLDVPNSIGCTGAFREWKDGNNLEFCGCQIDFSLDACTARSASRSRLRTWHTASWSPCGTSMASHTDGTTSAERGLTGHTASGKQAAFSPSRSRMWAWSSVILVALMS